MGHSGGPSCIEGQAEPWNPNLTELTATYHWPQNRHPTCTGLQFPIPTFTGRSRTKYWDFIHAFNRYLCNTSMPELHKQHTLLQACTGEDLKMALESCERLGPERGYERVLALLTERFRIERAYAEEWIMALQERPPISTGDGNGLRKLADALWGCISYLENWDMLSKLESWTCIRNIVVRLPGTLQEQCADKSHSYNENHGSYPGIRWLREFVQKQVGRTHSTLFKGRGEQ
ncbi:uncharacterized protein LOC121869873 [Homarus americanus]|uniref:uncharacterized protein LOC121869873 n=1 Tax=Homarus americanus TaxID=6706 RepID=UPI001C4848E1|nr:uncharacterized protein LOC121869873 [Homarus americanus]